MRFLAVISLMCFVLAGCGGGHQARPKSIPAKAANGPVVLGAKDFVAWGGLGFGTPHPSRLAVGSDPSVLIS
ncbi:MAG TPA: hypothetical protein VJU60_02060, partial [Thermoleophilaceae bacterium]|nr:hypothetical protein [Thermoleophilaceae bacterium]